ncbi:MAG TPA: DegQ family serine endoprotease, partial [Alphaproteobacteria bacterium]|nr:DegQ family serine endoprotease [Alphaproteobacteria bacterium]
MKKTFRAFAGFLFALLLATPAFAHSGPPGFADLAEKLLPAVVNISTSQTITSKDEMMDLPPDMQLPPGSPFEQFFHDFMDKQGKGGAKKHKATALGSGFIIDPSGFIVTNNHVIQDADEITVILQDDTNLTATVIGRDKKTDLALLKVNNKKPLPAVSWGDSDKVRVGDWIMAIGDPYGLGGTVTAGIISARARDIQSGPYDEYLQTDAPINRGNSGGPMFNMDGDVIGINTAIFSPSGGSIGIGFAIPSSLAKNVIDQVRDHGHIRRGWLGVHIQSVTQDIADSLGLEKPRGALVSSVTPDGPAAKAGVQPGDVILNFDGKEVPEMRRLPLMVAETDVDKNAPMTVYRKGEKVELKVKIGEMSGKEETADEENDKESAPAPTPNTEKVEDLGINVAPLTDSLRTKFGVKKDVNGLIVTNVSSDGIAADQGIEAGDVITEAAQENLKAAKELVELVKKAKKDNKPLLLLVNRKDDLRFVAITFGK